MKTVNGTSKVGSAQQYESRTNTKLISAKFKTVTGYYDRKK